MRSGFRQDSIWQGVAVPAHVTGSKGILEAIRGQQRISIIQHPGLIAVEDNKKTGR
jgi:hypothetical protein